MPSSFGFLFQILFRAGAAWPLLIKTHFPLQERIHAPVILLNLILYAFQIRILHLHQTAQTFQKPFIRNFPF